MQQALLGPIALSSACGCVSANELQSHLARPCSAPGNCAPATMISTPARQCEHCGARDAISSNAQSPGGLHAVGNLPATGGCTPGTGCPLGISRVRSPPIGRRHVSMSLATQSSPSAARVGFQRRAGEPKSRILCAPVLASPLQHEPEPVLHSGQVLPQRLHVFQRRRPVHRRHSRCSTPQLHALVSAQRTSTIIPRIAV